MNAFKVYILHSLILSVFILSIALLGCDTPECCGFGCGILGGSQSADCGASSSPPEPFMGFRGPGDIAVTTDGDFVVSETEARINAVVHVDQITGDRTILSDATTGTGP